MNEFIKNKVYNLLGSKVQQFILLFLFFIAFLSSIFLIVNGNVKVKLLPKPTADYFTIYVDLPNGSSVTETKKVVSCVVDKLNREENIINSSVFLGESGFSNFSALVNGRLLDQGENIANIEINLKRAEEREESSILMVHRLRPIINNNCLDIVKDTTIKFKESPAGPPVLSAIALEITSDAKYSKIIQLSKKVEGIFKQTKNVVDIDIVGDDKYNISKVVLNKKKIADSYLSLKQVKEILYVSLEGKEITYINEKKATQQVPLFLSLDENSKVFNSTDSRSILTKLSEIKLINKKGMSIPLNELVEIKQVQNNKTIFSKNLINIVTVTAEMDMDSQINAIMNIKKTIKKQFSNQYDMIDTKILEFKLIDKKTHEVFDFHWDGEEKLSIDTVIDLSIALAAALIVIFFMLVMYYHSFSLSISVLLASFLSIIGVIYIHWITNVISPYNYYLTGTSLIGFIALIGINSRNSILAIDYAKQLIEEGEEIKIAISKSVAVRTKPILLTVLAIIFASILLTTDPVFGGLGMALIGGTLLAFFVSLLIVPIIIFKPLQKIYKGNK